MIKRLSLMIAVALVAAVAPATAQTRTVTPEVAAMCEAKWGTDYRMRLWCQDKQMEAKAELDATVVVRGDSELSVDVARSSLTRCRHASTLADLLKCDPTVKRVDGEMNAAYTVLKMFVPKSKWAPYRERQRAWLRERDRRCRIHEWESGSSRVGTQEVIDCLIYRTALRRDELRWQFREL